MLTDIEFIDGFAADLSEDYASAKSYVRDIPTQALVYVRSFTHKLTFALASHHGESFSSPNLYDRIEQLNKARVIDVPTVRALHRLRGDGNRGAHPEKYHLTHEQLVKIAEKSIRNILKFVTQLYPKYHSDTPAYRFEEFDALVGRDLCYRASMQNDADAQYLVGMSLKAKALMQNEQEQAISHQSLPDEVQSDSVNRKASALSTDVAFQQAAHWFASASNRHHHALYEHGVSLLHGYQGTPQAAQGEQIILQAAEKGVVDAKALLGYFYLVGGESIEVDIDQSQQWLTKAAMAENAEAMSNLGVIYYQQQEYQKAFEWVSKAAQTGYPHAQFHLAIMFEQGQGCEVDTEQAWYWVKEAAQQGQLDAMLRCGTEILNNDNATDDELDTAERYLQDVVKYGRNATAMMELSVALADGMLGRIDVVQSAYLLRLAKEYADEAHLEVIEPIWQSLSIQIDSVIDLNPSEQELEALQHAKTILA